MLKGNSSVCFYVNIKVLFMASTNAFTISIVTKNDFKSTKNWRNIWSSLDIKEPIISCQQFPQTCNLKLEIPLSNLRQMKNRAASF